MQQEHEAQLACRMFLQRLLNGNEVLQGLGHLAAVDLEVTGVDKVSHPRIVAIVSLEEETR